MSEPAFDIFQTNAGYTAIENPVQRRILEALEEGDKQLPELVQITGKSKPTLSSIHVKELLNRELVEELPHPDDKRRKIYRFIGTRIGSSDIPVPQLRQAVQQYVSLTPLAGRFSLATVLRALAQPGPKTPPESVWQQATHLGASAASSLKARDLRDFWMKLLHFLQEEKVARPLRMDLEHQSVELEPLPEFGITGPHAAAAIAGFAHGAVQALDGLEGGVVFAASEGGSLAIQGQTV